MNYYFEVWVALALMFFIAHLATKRIYLSLSLPVFGLVTTASPVALSSVAFGPVNLRLTVLFVSLLVAALTLVYLRPKLQVALKSFLFAGAYGLGAAGLSLLTQIFGLASVAFSDGFTIMRASLWIQGIISESPLDGDRGLKRGFGISSVQALGERGEYLVGFMPIIFITAMICSLLIIFKFIGDRNLAWVVSGSLLVVMVSTEAILRQMYLMNSHTLIWLAFSVILLFILDKRTFELDPKSLITVLPLFSALAFARFDAVWIFAPFLIPIALVTYWRNKLSGFLVLASVLVPLAGWLLFAVIHFPFGGQLGVAVLLTVVIAAFLLAAFFVPQMWLTFRTLSKIYLWTGVSTSILVLLLSNFTISFDALFTNLVLGEGLWGISVISLAALALVAIFVRNRTDKDEIPKMLLAAGFLSLNLLLIAKLGDGFENGLFGGGFARIGWGDSVNRMLVAYIPFAVIFIGNFVNSIVKSRN